jgi:hypothetical protein
MQPTNNFLSLRQDLETTRVIVDKGPIAVDLPNDVVLIVPQQISIRLIYLYIYIYIYDEALANSLALKSSARQPQQSEDLPAHAPAKHQRTQQ